MNTVCPKCRESTPTDGNCPHCGFQLEKPRVEGGKPARTGVIIALVALTAVVLLVMYVAHQGGSATGPAPAAQTPAPTETSGFMPGDIVAMAGTPEKLVPVAVSEQALDRLSVLQNAHDKQGINELLSSRSVRVAKPGTKCRFIEHKGAFACKVHILDGNLAGEDVFVSREFLKKLN